MYSCCLIFGAKVIPIIGFCKFIPIFFLLERLFYPILYGQISKMKDMAGCNRLLYMDMLRGVYKSYDLVVVLQQNIDLVSLDMMSYISVKKLVNVMFVLMFSLNL